MTVATQDDPLILRLPEWIDTNNKYELVWDEITEAWTVLPF